MIYIKSRKGKLKTAKVTGNDFDLLAEFATCVELLKEKGIKEYMLRDMFEMGLADDKKAYMLKQIDKSLDKMLDTLKKANSKLEEENSNILNKIKWDNTDDDEGDNHIPFIF